MILHLDTHVVVWLYAGDRRRFPGRAAAAIDHARLVYCPAVGLELTYLHETGRIKVSARQVLDYLGERIGLAADDAPFVVVARAAETLTWTRDPFDRLITAAAAVGDHPLITRDAAILANYPAAVWE